jgi:kinetochore protein Mis13/DSN1
VSYVADGRWTGLTISRLRAEKDALKSLLRPPTIPQIQGPEPSNIDIDLLSEADSALLQSLQPSEDVSEVVTRRLDSFQNNLGPIVDSFADGVHKIGQYRDVAENVAGRVLSICSEKLAERDRESRKRALPEGEVKSPERDLNSVLRGLSRVDR